MAVVSFDGNTKIVQVLPGVDSLDMQECYSNWKDWVAESNNAIYEQAFRYVGGDPLPGSKQLGITYFLLNGWKIRPDSRNHTLTVDGNLYTEDGSSPYVSALGSVNVMVINSVSSLVDSTVQQLPEIEYASFNGGVHLDPINGTDGIEYPIGTPTHPCKTIMNAYMIDLQRGFNRVYLYSDLILDSLPDGFVEDTAVIGVGGYRTVNISINNTLVKNTYVENLNVSGSCKSGSDCNIYDCKVTNLDNISIVVENSRINSGRYLDADLKNCTIDGDIVLEDNGYFTGTGIVLEGDFTNIDMGLNSVVSLDIESGYLGLVNSTSGCLAEFNLKGGELDLDSSITGGDFYIEGFGTLYGDPVSLGMNVKANNLISLESIPSSVWNNPISGSMFDQEGSIGHYIKNKVLSVVKFLALK